MGDSTAHDYTFSMRVREGIKEADRFSFVCGIMEKKGEANDHIAVSIAPGTCEFYRSAGAVKRHIAFPPEPYSFESKPLV